MKLTTNMRIQTSILLLAATTLWASSTRLPDGREFPNWEKPLAILEDLLRGRQRRERG